MIDDLEIAWPARDPAPMAAFYAALAQEEAALWRDAYAVIANNTTPLTTESPSLTIARIHEGIRHDLMLCGEMFGLGVHRHRYFELGGFFAMGIPHGRHHLRGAETNTERRPGYARGVFGHYADHAGACEAMGIDWAISRHELAQAIPPVMTEFVGHQLWVAVAMRAAIALAEAA